MVAVPNLPSSRGPLALAAVFLLATGCATYQLGSRTLFRPDIQTVYVPMFESDSLRPHLGEWLTEAVVKEIEMRTPYKVVHTADADSVLTGRLVHDAKRTLATDPGDFPRVTEVELSVQISWFDRRGEQIMQNAIARSSNMVPEGGQSIVTAQQTVIGDLARQIVDQMEIRW
jgi:hypothetical protein